MYLFLSRVAVRIPFLFNEVFLECRFIAGDLVNQTFGLVYEIILLVSAGLGIS
jgi:hypothetical protein